MPSRLPTGGALAPYNANVRPSTTHYVDIETLHIFKNDYLGERPWDLLAWCRAHGAVEFNVDGFLTEGGSKTAIEAFDAVADPHRLPSAARYDMYAGASRPTDLWALNADTERALRIAFPRGNFDYLPADAWFENLAVYRTNGDLILGVITHESEGVLRVSRSERQELDGRGFVYRSSGEWVGFNEAAV